MSRSRMAADRGSAVVAAVFVAATVALIASQVTATSRSAIQAANGELIHARLAAETEGGLARAVANLQSGAWDLGRAPHTLDASPDVLSVQVEDERGKAPLNTLTEAQARALFQAAGVDGPELDALVTAFLDWRDPNRARPTAARAAPVEDHEGGFRTIEELRLIPGMTDGLYAALAPSITVSAGDRAFDPSYSTPVALAAMTGEGVGSPAALEAARELQGERTAMTTATPADLAGRTFTVRLAVERPDGSRFRDAWLVEMTGRTRQSYVVRGRTD